MEGNFTKIADLGSVSSLAEKFVSLTLKKHVGSNAKQRPFLRLKEDFQGMTECYLSNQLWDDYQDDPKSLRASQMSVALYAHKDGGNVLWLCKDATEDLETLED